jgi:predicted phosphate transport protein (TIGR00153 family)
VFKSKQSDLLETFVQVAENIQEAAKYFLEHAKGKIEPAIFFTELKKLEDKGDHFTHSIIVALNQNVRLSYEREEILSLAVIMDDILDGIEACASRFNMFHIEQMDDFMLQFAQTNYRCSNELVQLMRLFRATRLKEMRESTVKLNFLENEGDQILRSGMKELFLHEKDAIQIIKTKEIYEILEQVSDRFEDVADELEGIIMRNA